MVCSQQWCRADGIMTRRLFLVALVMPWECQGHLLSLELVASSHLPADVMAMRGTPYSLRYLILSVPRRINSRLTNTKTLASCFTYFIKIMLDDMPRG